MPLPGSETISYTDPFTGSIDKTNRAVSVRLTVFPKMEALVVLSKAPLDFMGKSSHDNSPRTALKRVHVFSFVPAQ